MPVEPFIYLFAILLIGALPRFYLLFRHGWVGKDTFYHFIVAESIKKKGFPPKTIDQFIKPEFYDYPPLLHVFLSYFDRKHYKKIQFLSPVSDIVTGIVIFCFVYYYLGIEVALISTFIYFVTPFVLDNAFSLNPRSIANLFLVLSLFSWYNYHLSAGILWLILSILCSSLVLLSHRLTAQCWGILLLSLSVWTLSWIPIAILAASIVLAVFITRGYYLTVIMGHVAFVREFGQKFFDRSSETELAQSFPSVQYVIFNLPLLILIPFFFIYPLQIQDTLSQFMLVWICALAALSIAWVFGEGIRHIICTVPAISILWAFWIVHYNLYLVLIPLGILSFLILAYKIFRLEKNPDISGIVSDQLMEAFNYINIHKKTGDILLCLPLDLTYNAAFFTDCIMLQSSGGFAEGLSFNQKLHTMVNQGKIDEIIDTYHPNWIITLDKSVSGLNQHSILEKYPRTFHRGDVTVLNVTGSE